MEYNPDTPEGIELLGKQRPNSMALVDEFMKDFEGDPLTIDEQAAAIAVASKMQGSFCVVPSFHLTNFNTFDRSKLTLRFRSRDKIFQVQLKEDPEPGTVFKLHELSPRAHASSRTKPSLE